MLSPGCLRPAWIRAKADELAPVDPLLLEKCIHALALLGHLSESDLNFVSSTILGIFNRAVQDGASN